MKQNNTSMKITGDYAAGLSKEIQAAYNNLIDTIMLIPIEYWTTKNISDTKEALSLQQIIAYQIGWGNLLVYWYNTGVQGIMPVMPGEGFTTWDYNGLAQHFYTKYAYADLQAQCHAFQQTVMKILLICEREHVAGRLDAMGVWPWCTLASGKEWPLAKWIRVNTVAPYKRARSRLNKTTIRTVK